MAKRRQAILNAANKAFQKNGFHKTSIDDICAAASVSVGALYTHFKNKREIILALGDQIGADYFGEPIDTLDAFKKALIKKVRTAAIAREDAELEFQIFAEAVTDPDMRERVVATTWEREKYFERLLTGLKKKGELAPDYDPHAGAKRINALLLGIMSRNSFLEEKGEILLEDGLEPEFAIMRPGKKA